MVLRWKENLMTIVGMTDYPEIPPIVLPENLYPTNPIHEVNGKRYSLILDNNTPFTAIRLENGEWSGVVYHYGKTRFLEEEHCLRLQFEYYIVKNPGAYKNEDADRFVQYIGDILVDIMDSKINTSPSSIPIMSQNEIGYLAD